MYKRKSNFLQTFVLIILSILLVMSITGSITLAFFSSSDNADGTLRMSGAVIVDVSNGVSALGDYDSLTVTYGGEALIPGVSVNAQVYSAVRVSTTASVLRARIDTVASGLDAIHNEQLNQWFLETMLPLIDISWQFYSADGWYYYLGSSATTSHSMVMTTTATDSVLTEPQFGSTIAQYTETTNRTITDASTNVIASVYPGAYTIVLPFLNQSFRIPYQITNEYSGATLNIYFYVEALQDYLVIGSSNVLPTVANAKTILDTLSPTHNPDGSRK